ncbi:hypothetical protein ACWEGE_23300 [Amycolatopsis sp. NPDC004747]
MRSRNTADSLQVHAVAGSFVVLFGIDLPKRCTKNLLGFAIERTDRAKDERYWLRGMKVFEETSRGIPPGTSVSLREHPLQSFQWATTPSSRTTTTPTASSRSTGNPRTWWYAAR